MFYCLCEDSSSPLGVNCNSANAIQIFAKSYPSISSIFVVEEMMNPSGCL